MTGRFRFLACFSCILFALSISGLAALAEDGDNKPDSKTESTPNAKPESKPDAKPETKPETKPEDKSEGKEETKPDSKSEPKSEQKPEAKSDSKGDAKPEEKGESKPDAKPEPKADPKDEAEFRELDVSEDGFLTGREAKDLLKYDTDGDKKVSLAEFLAGRAKDREAAKPVDGEKLFQSLDKNSDGVLSGKERKEYAKFDQNNDGEITKEEFLAGLAAANKPATPPADPPATPPTEPSETTPPKTKPSETKPTDLPKTPADTDPPETPPKSETDDSKTGPVQAYRNQKNKLFGDHAKNFVPFRLNYPSDWKLEKTAGTKSNPYTVRIERRVNLGKNVTFLQENFSVSPFTPQGVTKSANAQVKQHCEQMQKQITKTFKKVKMNPVGEMQFGNYTGQGFEFSFTLQHPTKKSEIKSWGRFIILPREAIKQPFGLGVVMLATAEAPELTDLVDLGTKGGLATIVNSFEIEAASAKSPSEEAVPPVP